MYENLTYDEKETQPGAFHMVEPFLDTKFSQHPCSSVIAGMPEKIKSDDEKYGVQQSGYQNPFPQPVLFDETVGFKIGLYGDDDFFEHNENQF